MKETRAKERGWDGNGVSNRRRRGRGGWKRDLEWKGERKGGREGSEGERSRCEGIKEIKLLNIHTWAYWCEMGQKLEEIGEIK